MSEKKKKGKENVLVPVELTLERGTPWAGGVRPMVSETTTRQEPPRPREVLPSRARQNASTLAVPGHVYSLIEFMGRNMRWDATPPVVALKIAAPDLLTDEMTARANRVAPEAGDTDAKALRFVTSDLGSIADNNAAIAHSFDEFDVTPAPPTNLSNLQHPSAAVRAAALYRADWAKRRLLFFETDPLPPKGSEPYGMAPDKYPAVALLRQRFQERFDRQDDLLRDSSERYPRGDEETIDRAFRRAACFPPSIDRRRCRKEEDCICMILAAQRGQPKLGYVCREFLLPSQETRWRDNRARGLPVNEENDGPVGLCIHDTELEWHRRVMANMELRENNLEDFNTYQVKCEKGEYARDFMHKNTQNGYKTGINGFVPRFLAPNRQYETVVLQSGTKFVCLVDTGMDFQSSLSEANMCLGAFKSHPLCGPTRYMRASSKTVFLPRRSLEQASGHPEKWVRFVRAAHTPVLADRHMLMALEEGGGVEVSEEKFSRIPAVWLRLNGKPNGMTPTTIHHILSLILGRGMGHDWERLEPFLDRLRDLAFGSYERSVALWIEAARQGSLLVALPIALALWNTPHFDRMHHETTGMWLPDRLRRLVRAHEVTNEQSMRALLALALNEGFVLIMVALFRWMTSVLFEHYVTRHGTDAVYYLRLFRDTHLDMLTHASLFQAFDDDHWFSRTGARPWLAVMYPQANRVICGEELPNIALAVLASNPFFDMGNKKAQENVFQAMIHPFLCKVLNQVCQRRQFYPILKRNATQFPVIGRLLRLIMRCMLLGNVRGEIDVVPLATRIRIAATFAPHASTAVSRDFERFMESKCLVLRNVVIGFYVGYVIECDPVLRDHLYASKNFVRYVALVRQANALWRREIAQQTATRGIHSIINWEVIEHMTFDYRESDSGKVHLCVAGKIMDIHDRSLGNFNKLKKGRFEEILLKKMTAIEDKLNINAKEMTEWMHTDELAHRIVFIAWVLAQRSNNPYSSIHERISFETRWLKYMKFSERGLDMVREMKFDYFEYDTADDTFKVKMFALYNQCPTDFVVLKTFARCYDYFRSKRVFFLPMREARLQIQALRNALHIGPNEASLPRMGKAYFCEGCLMWADPICTLHPVLAGDLRATRLALSQLAKGKVTVPSAAALPMALAFGTNANDGQVVSLRTAFINPLNGRLYCRRGRNALLGANALEYEENDDVERNPAGRDDVVRDPFENLAEAENNENWAREYGDRLVDDEETDDDQPLPPPPSRDISRVVLQGTQFTCSRPLIEVDMVGCHVRLRGRWYGLCVTCGIKTEIHDVNLTNDGHTCGKHPLVSQYPDYHRFWLALGVPRVKAEAAFVPKALHLGPCFACRVQEATRKVDTHDFNYLRFRVPLCHFHAKACSSLIALGKNRAPNTPAPTIALAAPPVLISNVMKLVSPN